MPDKSIGERVAERFGDYAPATNERLCDAIDAAIASDRQERCAGVTAELAAAEKRVAELVGLLKDIEWTANEWDELGCSSCHMLRDYTGHAPDCRLAAAIKGGA